MNKVHSIKNHFNNKTTYVIGEICCNGCQVFHKDEALDVFDKFDVPFKQRVDVYNLFDKYDPNEPFCLVSLGMCDEHMNSKVYKVLVEHYYNNHPELIVFLFNHPQLAHIITGMKYYTSEQYEALVDYNHTHVREELAKYCDKEQLDILVNDISANVRAEVAKRGFKDHLDKLVRDEENWVRTEVAKHGHKEHLDILVDDLYPYVREYVAEKGGNEHLDKLVHDEHIWVRFAVAMRNIKKYNDILVNDIEPMVRNTVHIGSDPLDEPNS